jgi:hypothetical protein
MGLQATRMSLNIRTKSLEETLADTKKDIHEELGHMFQVEA